MNKVAIFYDTQCPMQGAQCPMPNSVLTEYYIYMCEYIVRSDGLAADGLTRNR
ncbi:MAG: hypothetical protein F6J93_39195 [Oscillatoria sp. SIO1A7]|nr:hypothetical protein [Oscillatoria sp. SIO1A7]